ncbi:MAG: FAD-dependent oxidoreductase [Coprococcus sp.]|nr:FAD-dependent oxidoreductase [Coprococcus sp.]
MLRISQIKIRIPHTEEDLYQKMLFRLGIKKDDLLEYTIRRQSLDARHKPELFYIYTVDIKVKNEKTILKRMSKGRHAVQVSVCDEAPYAFPPEGKERMARRPVIVGSGPAGLFCSYFLAAYGYRPILIERGAPVEERTEDVRIFWEKGILKADSNVQFGEGGAGTFSDGKLNTLIKDPAGRIRKVLEIFVENGAPKEILYVNKPHVGTDVLTEVIPNIRRQILKMGGEVRFHTRMEELIVDEETGKVKGLILASPSCGREILPSDTIILAPGHSARDTFFRLYEQKIPMEAKSFAVGVRAIHPQRLIDRSQYGEGVPRMLPPAAYKLAAKTGDGRGVYSFCMCPGGYVVNASSEEGHLAVNGMSLSARDSVNANSAIVVTVTPEDFKGDSPLAGIEFQRTLERAAYKAGNGKIPVQRYGDFYAEEMGYPAADRGEDTDFSGHMPCMKGDWNFSSLTTVLPPLIRRGLIEGMEQFGKKIRGFSHPDTLLAAVESRTSSPIRIPRNEEMECTAAGGLYPCGEGAGYAGGIVSAAADGMRTAEAIRRKYAAFDTKCQD